MMMTMTKIMNVREGVKRAYSAAASEPQKRHPFPHGRAYADSLGYSFDQVSRLPRAALDAFAGVSCLPAFSELEPGDDVLDLGCGAGLDSLIASQTIGRMGSVTAVDFSEAMLARARAAAWEAGAANVECVLSDAEALPFDDKSFDKVIINGLFNLNPGREVIFRELARVLRPGGKAFVAELILTEPLPPEMEVDETEWFR